MSTENQTPETEIEETISAEALEAEAAETASEPAESDATVPQAQFDELNERYVRMAAEYDNFRKRSQRERDGIHADAVMFAVKALLPTLDNLERAMNQPTEDAEYKKGVELTYKSMLDAFASLNVKSMDAAPGVLFDPNFHNAVMHIEDESMGESAIAEVFQQGFVLGDKVVRHAMVKVAN